MPPLGQRCINVWQTRYINTRRLTSTTHKCFVQSKNPPNSICDNLQRIKGLAPLKNEKRYPNHCPFTVHGCSREVMTSLASTAQRFNSKNHFTIGLVHCIHGYFERVCCTTELRPRSPIHIVLNAVADQQNLNNQDRDKVQEIGRVLSTSNSAYLAPKEEGTVRREKAHPATRTSTVGTGPATIAGGARAGRHLLLSFDSLKVGFVDLDWDAADLGAWWDEDKG